MRKFSLLLIATVATSSLFAQVFNANSGNVCQAYTTRHYIFNDVPEATANATLTVSWAYCGGDGFPNNGTLNLWMVTTNPSNYQIANTTNSGNGCSWVSNTYTVPMAQINSAIEDGGGSIDFYGYINDGCPPGVGCSFADPCFNITMNFDSSPQASYSASSSAYCEGGTVVYESTSTGQIDDYAWDFGQDASPATAVGPGPHEVLYSTAGLKAVSLNISNAETSDLVEGEYEIFANPEISLTESQEICLGQTVTLQAASSETVSWNEGLADGLSQELSPEITTTYIATVVDENNCTASAEATVTVNQLPIASAGDDQSICDGNTLTLMASGGTEYNWNEGMGDTNEFEVSPTETTTYSVVVSDDNGCEAEAEVTITVNPNPSVDLTEGQEICLGETVLLEAASDYTVMWNEGLNDGISQELSPEMTTLYIATVVDENDCTASAEALITVNELPMADAGEDQSICEGGSVTLMASGGTEYNWNEGLGDSNELTVSPSEETIYSVVVTDENGCSSTDELTVTVNQNPIITINEPQEICLGESSVVQATSEYTVMWNEGLMDGDTQVVSPEESTLYIATVIDENDCSSSVEALVTVNPNPSIDITESQDICAGETVILEVISDYTAVWNEGLAAGSSQEVSPEATTLYTAAVIDENNCFTEVETLVTVNPNPELSILGYDEDYLYCQYDFLSLEGVPAGGEFTGTTDMSDLSNVNFPENGEQEISYFYTDENGCSSVLTLNFVTEICEGIEELKNTILVYPNPTSGIVNIDLGEAHVSISQIQIFDVQGKLLDLPLTRRGSLLHLDLSGYPNGVYTLSFSSEESVVSKKIVLQK